MEPTESKVKPISEVAALFALLMAVPGPTFVLLAYFIPIADLAPFLFLVGFQIGLVLNGPALLLGLFCVWRWKGFLAVIISASWWAWVYWALMYGDWNI